jgi:hypothetical protein
MEADLLAQILQALHDIKKDLRWFREREEQKITATREETEDVLKRLTRLQTSSLLERDIA